MSPEDERWLFERIMMGLILILGTSTMGALLWIVYTQ